MAVMLYLSSSLPDNLCAVPTQPTVRIVGTSGKRPARLEVSARRCIGLPAQQRCQVPDPPRNQAGDLALPLPDSAGPMGAGPPTLRYTSRKSSQRMPAPRLLRPPAIQNHPVDSTSGCCRGVALPQLSGNYSVYPSTSASLDNLSAQGPPATSHI